jgi:hypothetical protein
LNEGAADGYELAKRAFVPLAIQSTLTPSVVTGSTLQIGSYRVTQIDNNKITEDLTYKLSNDIILHTEKNGNMCQYWVENKNPVLRIYC